MGDISKNFYYAEFFVSMDHPDLAKAEYEREANNELFKDKLKYLCLNCLQPTRDYIGKPLTIISGYRDPYLNRAVGGVEGSDHSFCLAADFTADYDLYQLYKWMVDNICYRQVIYYPEQNFIHVSVNWFDKDYRHNPLVKIDGKYIASKDYFISKG